MLRKALSYLLICSAVKQTLATDQLTVQRLGSISRGPVACNFKQYNALGDSYAAGINAVSDGQLPTCNGSNGGDTGPYCTSESCAKNKGAYSWQFDQAHRPDNYAFAACSGADTHDAETLQVPNMPSEADVLTITIGGNNNNAFASVVSRCVYIPLQPGCTKALENAVHTVSNIATDLNQLFAKIKDAVRSKAKVVVLGYVTFWPPADNPALCQSGSLSRPDASQKKLMNDLVIAMNLKLKTAAEAQGFLFIDPNALFVTHRLCDKEAPWIQWDLTALPGFDDGDNDGVEDPDLDLYNRGVFHPTREGQDVYLQELNSVLNC